MENNDFTQLILTIDGDLLETEQIEGDEGNQNNKVELVIAPLTIIVGYNSSLKSLIARTVYSLLKRNEEELERLWIKSRIYKDYNVRNICLYGVTRNPESSENNRKKLACYKLPDDLDKGNLEIPKEYEQELLQWLNILIPDHRIVLRELLAITEPINELYQNIDSLNRLIENIMLPDESGITDLKNTIENINNTINIIFSDLFSIVDLLRHLKMEADRDSFVEIIELYNEILSLHAKAVEISELPIYNVKDTYRKHKYDIDVFKINILRINPPNQELYNIEQLNPSYINYIINVIDKRIGKNKELPLYSLSSSISAYIALELILYALSNPRKNKLMLIEEPEETLSPPHQFLLSLFLTRYIFERAKNTFLILTTHSPYIIEAPLAYLSNHKEVVSKFSAINLYYNYEKNKFIYGSRPLDLTSISKYLENIIMFQDINIGGDLLERRELPN